jgi:hypothetical protein
MHKKSDKNTAKNINFDFEITNLNGMFVSNMKRHSIYGKTNK